MPRALTRLALVLGACAVGGAAEAADESPLAFQTGGLSVSVELVGLEGDPLAEAQVGEPFRLRIAFAQADGTPAVVTNPIAWLRRAGPGAATCQDSARATRVTGRLAAGDVPLAGLSVVTVDASNRIAIVDPNRPESSRIVSGIVEMGERPGGTVVHPGRGEFVFSRPDRGDVLGLPLPWGKARVLASGLLGPGSLLVAPGGRLWIEARDRILLLDRGGAILHAEAVGSNPRLLDAGNGRILVVGTDGAATMLDRATGARIAAFPTDSVSRIASATPDGILTGRDGRIVRIYADSPGRSEALEVPGLPIAVQADAAGRWALILTQGETKGYELHLVDLPTGRRVHSFAAPEPFDEVVMTDGAVFLTWPSRAVVTVIDLASLSKGDAAVRDVRLNEASTDKAKARGGAMMVSLAPLSAVAVMRPGGRTLHTVLAGGGLGSTPVSAIELKGEVPVALAAYPRSLLSLGPGRFEAIARLPRGGRWELVATTGIGGTTGCLPIPSVTEPEPPPAPSLAATIAAREGETTRLAISLRDWPEARPVQRLLRLRAAAIDGTDVMDLEAVAWEGGGYRTGPIRMLPTTYAISLADGAGQPDPAIVDLSTGQGAPATSEGGR